ncbi:hypothetical protein M433DRAFT_63243 [Acidomyces richmondensis BFW]|nr:hypothetical protein M433DRAFT_63243 [Acidomyces richmondensis BFW]
MDAPEAPYLPHAPAIPVARLPAAVRFFLVCVLSLTFSTLCYSLASEYAGYELAAVSRTITDDRHVSALLGWKFLELSFAWYAGHEWKDLAALTCLSNVPYYFLLHTFYDIDGLACMVALAIDVGTIAIPFFLLRPLMATHHRGRDPNRQVAQDNQIFILTMVLGAATYAIVVYGSLCTWIPVYLLTHFDKIRSLEHAHNAAHHMVTLMLLPVGWATARFLFTPMIESQRNLVLADPKPDLRRDGFDPETATFGETLAYNLGLGKDGFSKRIEVLLKRSVVLIICSVVNTFVRVLMTLDGSEPVGAAGWASVWGIAAMLTSITYAWVGNE